MYKWLLPLGLFFAVLAITVAEFLPEILAFIYRKYTKVAPPNFVATESYWIHGRGRLYVIMADRYIDLQKIVGKPAKINGVLEDIIGSETLGYQRFISPGATFGVVVKSSMTSNQDKKLN